MLASQVSVWMWRYTGTTSEEDHVTLAAMRRTAEGVIQDWKWMFVVSVNGGTGHGSVVGVPGLVFREAEMQVQP